MWQELAERECEWRDGGCLAAAAHCLTLDSRHFPSRWNPYMRSYIHNVSILLLIKAVITCDYSEPSSMERERAAGTSSVACPLGFIRQQYVVVVDCRRVVAATASPHLA